MNIFGDCIQPGSEFEITKKPTWEARSTFSAITDQGLHVTKRLSDLFNYEDDTMVLAHWHGTYATNAYILTVGQLREKAQKKGFLSE